MVPSAGLGQPSTVFHYKRAANELHGKWAKPGWHSIWDVVSMSYAYDVFTCHNSRDAGAV